MVLWYNRRNRLNWCDWKNTFGHWWANYSWLFDNHLCNLRVLNDWRCDYLRYYGDGHVGRKVNHSFVLDSHRRDI